MDLDGAKQDTGWRSGTDASRFQQFFHFGQPPAYGFTSQVRPTGTPTDQLHSNSTGYENFGPVKNRVAELLTNPAPAVEHLFPDKYQDINRNQDGHHTSLQSSLTNGSSSIPTNTFLPPIVNSSEGNISAGHIPDEKQLHGSQSNGALYQSNNPLDSKTSVAKYSSSSRIESSSSLGNLEYVGNPPNDKQHAAATDPNIRQIQKKSRNMAETSAIQHQNSRSFNPFMDLSQHQVIQNYSANDSRLNGEINPPVRNRSTSFDSIHTDNSSRSSVHSIGSSQGKVGERESIVVGFSQPNATPQAVEGAGQPVAGSSITHSRPASRSWSPWDNMIRSTNSSPATVSTSSSQPPSPVLRSSPVHSPFSSSASSFGSLNMPIPNPTPFIGGVPGSTSAVDDHNNHQQNTPKDPFCFLSDTKEMKPPDSLPRAGKPVKKKNSGKLKESRRKRGMPFPDDSLDEINPELARMIRESKAKEEMKKKKTDTNKKVKQLPGNPEKSPAPGSPLDRVSPFSNHDLNAVIKSASPYEFIDESEDFSAGVLHNTLNTNINVNSKMYSMSEMLAMTNNRSDSVDTKIEVPNGEVKVKKKKKKKTVEKMLANPNALENPYPVPINIDAKAKEVNVIHDANLSGNSNLQSSAYNLQPSNNSSTSVILQSHSNQQVSSNPTFLIPHNSIFTSGGNVSNVKDNRNVQLGSNNNGSMLPQQGELPVQKETDTTTANIAEFNTLINSSTLSNPSVCKNDVQSKISKLNENNLLNSSLGCCECGSLNGAISPLCKVHNPQNPFHYRDARHLQNNTSSSNINLNNPLRNVDQSFSTSRDNRMLPMCKNSANMPHSKDSSSYQNVLKNVPLDSVNVVKNDNVPGPKFLSPIIKSEHCEMDFEKYLSGCNDPNIEGALLNNLEASIGNLFTKTFLPDNSPKNMSHDIGNTGQLKRSSSWHDIHDMTMKAKKFTNKMEKKNPLLDPNIPPTVLPKQPKIKKTKLHGVNGVNKNLAAPIGPFASPEEERLDRLRNNRPEIPSCSCFSKDMMPGEADEGPYYTQLGSGKSIPSIREQLEKQTGISGSAIRIEKVMYSGKEGKSPQGCPIAKWIIRRSGPDEKYLCVVKHRKGHSCDATFIIVVLVAWEGVPKETADDLYSHLVGSLTKNGFETDRRCGTNEKKTCACQGVDLIRRGASFSFGCSWSMYFNGCKYARSREVRKFKLKDTSKEEELESRLQTLATKVGPLYQKVAPKAHSNQCEFKEGKECRLGSNELKPFSGVTACVDFCAHAHKDLHNMNNGSTVVVTLTKHRGLSKPDDEQLHVLPLYTLDPTDEHGSYDNQMEKVRQGALEILHNFPHEARMRAQPLTPKKKGKNAKKDQSPGSKKDALNNMKPNVPNLQLNGKMNKNSNHAKDKICKAETSKTNYCPPVKFENKDNLTFDNLMSLANMPGFSEIYDSFWNFFYSNGSFPPSNFLEKFGAKLPFNSVNDIKTDVNNPSNTMIHKPSAEMEQHMDRQLSGNNVKSAQSKSFINGYNNDTQAINKNIHQSHPSQQLSGNTESQLPCDLNSVQKNNFQEHQMKIAQGNSYPFNKDHIFKVPKTPDAGVAINNLFRSPEHPEQKTDWQRLPHHPISSLSQAEKENHIRPNPPPSPNFLGQLCSQAPLPGYHGDKQNITPNNQLQSFYNQQHNNQYPQTFQSHQQQFSHNQFQPGQNSTYAINSKQQGVNRQLDAKTQHGHHQHQQQQHHQQLQQPQHQQLQQPQQNQQQHLQQQQMLNSYLEENQHAHQRQLEQGVNKSNLPVQNSQHIIPHHGQQIVNFQFQSVHGYHHQPNQQYSTNFTNHPKTQEDNSGPIHQGFAQLKSDKHQLASDWQAAKRPCLLNDSVQHLQPNQNPVEMMQKVNNGVMFNKIHVSNGANIPSNTQNCLPLPQGRNFQMDSQNLPSNDNSQFSNQRNNIINNDQRNLPQHSPTNSLQHTIHSGSNLPSSQLSTPAKQSFESPLHMLSEAASVTYDLSANQQSNHLENRATPTFPQFSNPVPCEPNSHLIKQSQENQHHHMPSMQNASKPQTSNSINSQEHSVSVNCGHPPNNILNNLQNALDVTQDGPNAGNHSAAQGNPDEPAESIIDPTVVHYQMEYNEESFHDPEVGGVAIALSHGAVLFEVAKRELHATTALKNPNRYKPTRISLVFYQHKNLNHPNHGFSEYELKSEKLRLQKLEKRKESIENGEIIAPELKIKKKKKKDDEEEIDFAKTSAAQYKFMWEAPVSHTHALTTDSIITRWIDPQPMVTGPYQRWVLPTC